MKKLSILLLIFFSASCTEHVDETYFCSAEMSRFDRPGEIEFMTLKRTGNFFIRSYGKSQESKFKIISETSNFLTLYNEGYEGKWGWIIFLNKKTLEYGVKFFDMEEFRIHPPSTQTYGDCILNE
tara:strand:- start:1067 stop:1441 length:375 start_codon:yes stop_codon:yes gene_type:complete